MIPVNKPFLPPVEDYKLLIEGIWQRNWLTNNGPLVNELELELKHYLECSACTFYCQRNPCFANGHKGFGFER